MARGMIGVASAMVVSTGNLAMALNHLPFLVCLASVIGLCIGFARHRILHRESETDGERMELRYGGEALSSNLQIKRNSFKNSFSFKHSFSRSVSSKQGSLQGSLQGNGSSEEVRNEPLALWQKAILRGERCVPLSFSGLVLYDENGNLLPKRNKSFIRD